MELHNLKNPLRLIWNGYEYRVNKPSQETQELVSKEIAEDLKNALGLLIDNGYQTPSNKDLNKAIEIYNKSLI